MKKKILKKFQSKKINIIGIPEYNYSKYEIAKNFIFTVTFQIYPKCNLLKFNDIKIDIPTVKISNNDINNYISKFYDKNIIWLDKKNQIVNSLDRVTIDIFNYVNNKKFTNIKLILSNKWKIISNLEPNIINKKNGDQFNLIVLISDNYPDKELVGTKQNFSILIKRVENCKTVFIIKKNIFNSNSITSFTFKNLYKIFENKLKFKINKMIRYIIKYKVINLLINLHKKIKLPLLLINSEFDSINKIYKQNKIKFNKNLIINFLYEELSFFIYYNDIKFKKIIKYYLKNNNLIQKLYNLILEHQVIQIILKKILMNKIQYSYKDIKREFINIIKIYVTIK
ncbi:hypothetical protein GJT82_01140 [Enterobacteriaceae endosymbiont of Plateumaris rustica]|nr:hypothetical protein GJT82_01140 [Enterobacteriaceae endosymbiont of Plateumaris rustica]